VVTTVQLRECGLMSQAIYRRVQKRRLIRLYANVYAVGQLALSSGWRDQAAVLACGPGALLSHRSAGHMWEVRRTSSMRIEVTAPRARRGPDAIIVHRSRLIHPEDRAVVSGIPVTSVARTLVDLADVVSLPSLERAINQAELLGLFDLDALERTLARLPNRRGRGRLRHALDVYRPRTAFTRSGAERSFLRLCSDHGLPEPKANLSVAGHEVDFFWSDVGLIVEVDGAAIHQTRLAFHQDRRRDRELAAHGYQVVRMTERDLQDPAALAGEMKRLRGSRAAASVGRPTAA
jgi:very-short-patch-repair endonuclease